MTWSGCGRHVDRVMAGVPAEARCRCGEKPGAGKKDGTDPSAPAPRKKLFGIF